MKIGKAVRATGAAFALSAMISCAGPSGADPQAQIAAHSARTDLSAMGWDAISVGRPDYIVFGEVHGTQEAPLLFGRVAGELAQQGKNILIAVELSSAENARYQAAWNGPHDRFAASLPDIDWVGGQDGRTSVAMLSMLTHLHALKAGGARLALVPFNGFRDEEQQKRLETPGSQAGHDAAQAENIAAARAAGQYDHVLVLVGNLHARTVEVEGRGPTFQPMAMRLRETGRLVALTMAYASGTTWDCSLRDGVRLLPGQKVTDAMLDCGSHPSPGLAGFPNTPHFALGPMPGAPHGDAYDGHFWLGEISASPPAKP